jgi:hypothetical protein
VTDTSAQRRTGRTLEKVGPGVGGLEAQSGIAVRQALPVEAEAQIRGPSVAAPTPRRGRFISQPGLLICNRD